MAITFNNIPKTVRTPGTYAEIDNSRALTGLAALPHKVLILGQKIAAGSVDIDTLVQITSDGLADGFFGPGSVLARMCNIFKDNNETTELWAMALGSAGIGGTAASATIDYSAAMYSDIISGNETYYLMINGFNMEIALTSGMSGGAIASIVASTIKQYSQLPVIAYPSAAANSMGNLAISAVVSGTLGNKINIRHNYNVGESTPVMFSTEPTIVSMADGATDPDLGDAWAVIDGERFHYIIQPYTDSSNLTEIENELADRFDPLEDLQGHGFTAGRLTQADATTLGNGRNSPHNTIIAAYDSPTCPEEWAAALGAVAAFNLNIDPARPLHALLLKNIKAPPVENRFTRAEKDILLYDGIATWIWDSSGNIMIERCITTYQTNSLGITDPSYLDIQTLATLGEIRDQFKVRMSNRFISPRFKLADDTFPVQPGSYVATPSSISQEIVGLFTELRDAGYIENLDDFIDNLRVERDNTDRNRVNVLLSPDLINQFRVLAALIQFIL